MPISFSDFRRVWCVDFEYIRPKGEVATPVCMVAREILSGKTLRVWQDNLPRLSTLGFSLEPKDLFIAFQASAECHCLQELGLPSPINVLDLFVENLLLQSKGAISSACGTSLLGVLETFGCNHIGYTEKQEMRNLIICGGPWTAAEQKSILDYCESDVVALQHLLPKMLPKIDFPRALWRGRFMPAVAHIERNGIPIDVESHNKLRHYWPDIKLGIVERRGLTDLFDGNHFRHARFEAWLKEQNIDWPHTDKGNLKTDDQTLKEFSAAYPEIIPIRETLYALNKLKLEGLIIGSHNRNRPELKPFFAITSRNSSSNKESIYGPAVWMRGLIKPEPGMGLGYLDWSAQEIAIAAKLSGDQNLQAAYESGDPYLWWAKRVGALPPHATKKTHPQIREMFKTTALGINYGMGVKALAIRLGKSIEVAKEILATHQRLFQKFWLWSDATVFHARNFGYQRTLFGWEKKVNRTKKETAQALKNYPMQSNASEMMRWAACLLTEAGIQVCWPVHDAFLIEAPLSQLRDVAEYARKLMVKASADVLGGGFEVPADVRLFEYPNRYSDERGEAMWKLVWELVEEKENNVRDFVTPSYEMTGICES